MTHLNKTTFTTLPALALALACIATPDQAGADSNPFIGEIAAMGNNYCPVGWQEAAGQLLAISQNDALYSLLGTIYGGDGRTTFGLPDLRSRIPMGVGNGPGLTPRTEGERGGQENVSLGTTQLASHGHTVNATREDGNFAGPGSKILAAAPAGGSGAETIYSDQPANVQMSAQMIAPAGASEPIPVQDPTLVIRYCIALFGVYPSRS